MANTKKNDSNDDELLKSQSDLLLEVWEGIPVKGKKSIFKSLVQTNGKLVIGILEKTIFKAKHLIPKQIESLPLDKKLKLFDLIDPNDNSHIELIKVIINNYCLTTNKNILIAFLDDRRFGSI